jgi:hypothetical protein
MQYAEWAIWCLFVITGLMIYIPVMFIRKLDKVLKLLERIEANTQKK